MGVPKFYRWLSERYPTLSQVVNDSQIPEFDNLYLDMNGIIHNCSHPNDDDITFRITEEQMFLDIFAYIEKLFTMIKPQRVFFMAIDGVAPRAKMNQQRARRFMSARTAKEQLEAAMRKGEEIPVEDRFDSNCITPGTPFMDRLHKRIMQWVEEKVNNDPIWQNNGKLRVIYSGHNCAGEGEHKIMDFIRAERASSSHDPNTRHCLYGLDADLVMLGMCSHEPHFSLLREEVKFNRPVRKGKKPRKPEARKQAEETKFHLLHLQLLREYLGKEFESMKGKLSFDYDMERIIDDWVLMCYLVGNDFIPHLPHIHIHEDALPLLYESYREAMPMLDGYLNVDGYLQLSRFEKFLKVLAKNDKRRFMHEMEDEEYLNSKRQDPSGGLGEAVPDDELVAFDDPDMSSCSDEEEEDTELEECSSEAAFVSSDEERDDDVPKDDNFGIASAEEMLASLDADNDPIEDEFAENLKLLEFKQMDDKEFENSVEKCWSVPMNNAFRRHKRRYYRDKMLFANISKSELKAQAEGYIRAIQWNLHYYYHGCASWSWFFPFHYAPFISDVAEFGDIEFNFEKSEPFRPFEQLLAVLPAASAECLPPTLRELMTDPNSPIADFYPTDFSTDLNGKKNDWEAVVLVPFIKQDKLLEAIRERENRLSEEEKSRNMHGPHIMYTADMQKEAGTRAVRTLIDKDAFRIDQSTVVSGLLPGVKLDVFFPGFPTMMHLPHKAALKSVGVTVFNMQSRKDSMVLTIEERKEFQQVPESIAPSLLDQEVYIDWPILTMAKVGEIWTADKRFVINEVSKSVECEELDGEKSVVFSKLSRDLQDRQLSRYAIETGPINVIAFCKRFLGCTYAVVDGVMKRTKQWRGTTHDSLTPVALQLVVTNVNTAENRVLGDLPLVEALPIGSKVFTMSPEWRGFGHPGVVREHLKPGTKDCRIVVNVNIMNSPDLTVYRQNVEKYSLAWMSSYDAARRSGMKSRLLSRITGTVYLYMCSREDYDSNPGAGYQKLNIGLGLKLSKRNQEVPDYTKRDPATGYWSFSLLAVNMITEYRNKFKDLITYLEQVDDVNDVYFAPDIWSSDEQRDYRLEQLREFLDNVPTSSIEKIAGGSEYADSLLVGTIEKLLGPIVNKPGTRLKTNVNPAVLYKPGLNDKLALPDPDADFQLLDRVTYASEEGVVPCGLQGTIIGLDDDHVEVLFDRPFKGAVKIRSTYEQCYRVRKPTLINITFGVERKGKSKAELSARSSTQQQRQQGQRDSYRKGANNENTSGPYTAWAPRGQKHQKETSSGPYSEWKPKGGQRNNQQPAAPIENTSGPYVEWKPKGAKNDQSERSDEAPTSSARQQTRPDQSNKQKETEAEVPVALKLLTRAQNQKATIEKDGVSKKVVHESVPSDEMNNVMKMLTRASENSQEKNSVNSEHEQPTSPDDIQSKLSSMLGLNKVAIADGAENTAENANTAVEALLKQLKISDVPKESKENIAECVQELLRTKGVVEKDIISSAQAHTEGKEEPEEKWWFKREESDQQKQHHSTEPVSSSGGRGQNQRRGGYSAQGGRDSRPGSQAQQGGPHQRGGHYEAQRPPQMFYRGRGGAYLPTGAPPPPPPTIHMLSARTVVSPIHMQMQQNVRQYHQHQQQALPSSNFQNDNQGRGFFFGNSHTTNVGRGGRGGHAPGRGQGSAQGSAQDVDVFKKLKVDVNVTDLQPSVISRPKRGSSGKTYYGGRQQVSHQKSSEAASAPKQKDEVISAAVADLLASSKSNTLGSNSNKPRKKRLAAKF